MADLQPPAAFSRNYSGSSQFATPAPLVTCVLGGIDFILKSKFHSDQGILDNRLWFLDPAAGLMNFPLGLLEWAHNFLDPSALIEWIHSIFSPKSFLFEIDPLVLQEGLCQIQTKITQILKENLSAEEDTPLPHSFCMNTLLTLDLNSDNKDSPLIREGLDARESIPNSQNEPLIIFGNPPFAVSSQTKSPWISKLIDDYKADITQPGNKRIVGLKGIQDDYVKFLRFGQWKLADQDHSGILAFVLNNYFLDGTIFRGLRSSLLQNFDEIWVINLHGDPKKHTKTDPHSSQEQTAKKINLTDENVFDIQTGICLLFCAKYAVNASNLGIVHYCETFGSKNEKFAFLSGFFSDYPFQSVGLNASYSFIPKGDEISDSLEQIYLSFPYLPDIFQKHIVGAQSLHDTLITHPDKASLLEILNLFYSNEVLQESTTDAKGHRWVRHLNVVYHDARDWTIDFGLKGNLAKACGHIIPWQWRGFDQWWVAFDEHLITKGSSSFRLQQFMWPTQHNIAIGVSRVSRKAAGGSSVFVTNTIGESHFIEGGSGIGDYIFPLRINSTIKTAQWDSPALALDSNINSQFKSTLSFQDSVTDEMIFAYCYGILFTLEYRLKFRPFLKNDFPHIPFPLDLSEFLPIAKLGHELISLHLLESTQIKIDDWPISANLSPEEHFILKPTYVAEEERIYFADPASIKKKNQNTFWIGNITQAMWDFEIGGLAQLELWLKHRIYHAKPQRFGFPRAITYEELTIFLRICSAIKETLKILPSLDESYQNSFSK